MSPALAVKIAGREGPNSCFLFQLIVASHSDPHYRHSGMADMCIRHIVQEQQSVDLRHWEHPITGLLTIFASVDHIDSRDAAILQKIHSSYPRIFKVIADDILNSSTMVSNIAKMIACQFLQRCLKNVVKQYVIPSCRIILCAHLIYKRSMYDECTLGLIFHCWLEPDISQPNPEASQARVTAARVLAHLLSIEDSDSRVLRDYLATAFQAVDIFYLISRVKFALMQKGRSSEDLMHDIKVLRLLAQDPSPFTPHFLAKEIPKQVALAMRRHIKKGQANADDILREGELFFWYVFLVI